MQDDAGYAEVLLLLSPSLLGISAQVEIGKVLCIRIVVIPSKGGRAREGNTQGSGLLRALEDLICHFLRVCDRAGRRSAEGGPGSGVALARLEGDIFLLGGFV